jgi:hypothetical protein
MNIQKMLKQAQRMQDELAKAQADLAAKSVEAVAGGGKVRVTASGTGDILSIKIDPSVVSADDVELLEDLVLAGVRQAQEDAKAAAAEDMKKVTGGMNLPGLGF